MRNMFHYDTLTTAIFAWLQPSVNDSTCATAAPERWQKSCDCNTAPLWYSNECHNANYLHATIPTLSQLRCNSSFVWLYISVKENLCTVIRPFFIVYMHRFLFLFTVPSPQHLYFFACNAWNLSLWWFMMLCSYRWQHFICAVIDSDLSRSELKLPHTLANKSEY